MWELRKQSPALRDYTACYHHGKLVTPQMFQNPGCSMSASLPSCKTLNLKYHHCRMKNMFIVYRKVYFSKQNIPASKSPMSRSFVISLAYLAMNQITLKSQLRLCAAPQWLGERSAAEEKEATQDTAQIYQASLLLTSPVTKRTKSSVLMNVAIISQVLITDDMGRLFLE